MMKKLLLVLLMLAPACVLAQGVSFTPGVTFSGSPSYVSEFATRFRDNGGPLSPFGSHYGLKAEVRDRRFAGVLHYACATGRNILDYSRTGLAGQSSVALLMDGVEVGEASERSIEFQYFGWEEDADLGDLQATARVCFLGLDSFMISVHVENRGSSPHSVGPVFRFAQGGRQLSLLKDSTPERVMLKFSVQPMLVPGDNYLAVVSSASAAMAVGFADGFLEIRGAEAVIAPGAVSDYFYVFGYCPDDPGEAASLAEDSAQGLANAQAGWDRMLEMRQNFFDSLPAPHLDSAAADYVDLYRMAAVALENTLYAPRGEMEHWACVPTKVHYNWFWLWDSGFQALGLSEFRPAAARDVILTMFQAQTKSGFIAHMADEREKPLTPHSQPPVFGYSAFKMIRRHPNDQDYQNFEIQMYEQSKSFLAWWDKQRDENHNGLFEYVSQDEGGWDNSPRMDYVHKMIFISYWGSLGEIIGSKIKPLDNTDLNAWMYAYYRAMEEWADDLDKPLEARQWRQKALDLAARVDEVMWDPEASCWLDTYQWQGSKTYHHFRVLTPHIWFPAFTGATRDESKARQAIEKHLLNPDEFFGRYPIPVVAYNDPRFDITTAGWTASIWMVTAYSALEALFRFGYEDEALDLRARLMAMMADQDGMKGIYETYDPQTGKYKDEYSNGGYASFQFGWSSAFTLEMILQRYQEERFVFADTTRIRGHIRRAEDFDTRDAFYRVEAWTDTPLLELESADSKPLLTASRIRIKLSQPYARTPESSFKVRIRGREFEIEPDREYVLEVE